MERAQTLPLRQVPYSKTPGNFAISLLGIYARQIARTPQESRSQFLASVGTRNQTKSREALCVKIMSWGSTGPLSKYSFQIFATSLDLKASCN